MQVVYTPEGGDEKRWDFSFQRVRRSEAIIVEKAYGRTWAQFSMDAMQHSAEALGVLLWMLQRRDHPTLRLEDVPDFYLDELELDFGVDEWRAIRDEASKSKDPQAPMAVAAADQKIAEAEAREAAAGEGKATSSSAASTA